MKTLNYLSLAFLTVCALLFVSCDSDDADLEPEIITDDSDPMDPDPIDDLSLLFTTQTEEDQIGQFADNAMVEYDGNVWVVGGHIGFGPPYFTETSQVWRSENGANWLSVSSGQFPDRVGHSLNVIDGKMIMIGGVNNSTSEDYGDIWSSTDGLNWTLESDSSPFGKVFYHTVTEFNGVWYLIHTSSVYSSTNGIDWTFETVTDFAASNYQETVVLNNMLYVVGGLTASGIRTNEVWRTANGTTWEEVTLSGDVFTPRIDHTVTAYNGRAYILGGRAGTTIYRDIYYSSDMENWTSYPIEDEDDGTNDGLYAHSTLQYEDALWIFGGYNSTQAVSSIQSIEEE